TCKLVLPFRSDESAVSSTTSDELRQYTRDQLRSDLIKLGESSGVPVIVLAAHTDSVGTEEYNLGLSFRRAKATYRVLDSLLGEDHGIPIYACAYGETRPLAADQTGDSSSDDI